MNDKFAIYKVYTTYTWGNSESNSIAEQRCFNKAKISASQSAYTQIKSFQSSSFGKLKEDRIKSISNNELEILKSEAWQIKDRYKTYQCSITAKINILQTSLNITPLNNIEENILTSQDSLFHIGTQKLDYYSAFQYCKNLDGSSNWRLVTKDEVNEMIDTSGEYNQNNNIIFIKKKFLNLLPLNINLKFWLQKDEYESRNGNIINFNMGTISYESLDNKNHIICTKKDEIK